MSVTTETQVGTGRRFPNVSPDWLDDTGKAILDRASAAYSRDKVLIAAKAVDELKLHIASLDDVQAKRQEVETLNPWIQVLSQDVEDVSKLFRLLIDEESSGSWEEVANSNSIRTYYRKESDTAVHSIKVHAEILCPLVHLCAICNECDLIPTFMTMVPMEAQNIRQLTDFSQLVYFKASLIWPFSDRDIAFEGRGIDMLESGCVPIVAHPATEDPVAWARKYPGTPFPEVPNGCTRMGLHFSGGVLRALGPRHTLMSAIFNVDPRLAVVPTSLINWMTRKFAHLGFEMLRDQMDRFTGSAFERRVQEKKDFYDDIQRRIDEMWLSRISATGVTTTESKSAIESKSSSGDDVASISSENKDESIATNTAATNTATTNTATTETSSISTAASTSPPADTYCSQLPSMLQYGFDAEGVRTSAKNSTEYSIGLGLELFGGSPDENPTALYYALRFVDPGIVWAGKIQIESWGSFVGLSWRDVWCVIRKTPEDNPYNISAGAGIYIFGGSQIQQLVAASQKLVGRTERGDEIKPTRLGHTDVVRARERFARHWDNLAQYLSQLNQVLSVDQLRNAVPESSRGTPMNVVGVRTDPKNLNQIFVTLPTQSTLLPGGVMDYYQKIVKSVTSYEVPSKAFSQERLRMNDSISVSGWTLNVRVGTAAEALMWKWAFEQLLG